MIWDEWGRLTRFFESSRIALAREAHLWDSLELANHGDAVVRIESDSCTYQVSLQAHTEAVSDTWFLYASALLSYFALAESAAADALGREDLVGLDAAMWGDQLLERAGASWDKVPGGRIGILEVAVVRNLIAHGDRTHSKRSISKLTAAGMKVPPRIGDPVVLDDKTFREYRRRLKLLLNRAGLGAA